MSETVHDTSHVTENVLISQAMQVVLFFALTAVILFAVLMTTYPPVHDSFHGLRHALMIIPCH